METLPKELVTHLFSFSYTWQEILSFRAVCREWDQILGSLKRMTLDCLPPLPFLTLFPLLESRALIFSGKSATPLVRRDLRLSSRKSLDLVLNPETLGTGTLYIHHLLGWVAEDLSRTLMCQMRSVLLLGYGHGTLVLCSHDVRFWGREMNGVREDRRTEHVIQDVLESALDLLPVSRVYLRVCRLFLYQDYVDFFIRVMKDHPDTQFYVEDSLEKSLRSNSRFQIPNNALTFPTHSPDTCRFTTEGKTEYDLVRFVS